jgi:hypothetical protein
MAFTISGVTAVEQRQRRRVAAAAAAAGLKVEVAQGEKKEKESGNGSRVRWEHVVIARRPATTFHRSASSPSFLFHAVTDKLLSQCAN